MHFGSKGKLLLAVVSHMDSTGDLGGLVRRVVDAPDALTALDRAAELHATYDRQIIRMAMVLASSRGSDADVDAAWQDRMEQRRRFARSVLERIKREGLLAPGWTIAEATDAWWAITSPQMLDLLVGQRGWSTARYRRYLSDVLRRTFTTAATVPARRRAR